MTRSALHGKLSAMSKFADESQEFAWAVGIFEGEGSVILGGHKRWPCFQLKLGMTDKDVIERASAVLGLKVTGPYAHKQTNRKPMWRATKGGPEAREMAERMLPYLGTRRAERIRECLAITANGYRIRKARGEI